MLCAAMFVLQGLDTTHALMFTSLLRINLLASRWALPLSQHTPIQRWMFVTNKCLIFKCIPWKIKIVSLSCYLRKYPFLHSLFNPTCKIELFSTWFLSASPLAIRVFSSDDINTKLWKLLHNFFSQFLNPSLKKFMKTENF